MSGVDRCTIIGRGIPTRFFDVLRGTSVEAASMARGVAQLFSRLPVALRVGERAVAPDRVGVDALIARGSLGPQAGITRREAVRA